MFQSAGFFSLFLLPIQGQVDTEKFLKTIFFSHGLSTNYKQHMVATFWGSEYTRNILCLQKGLETQRLKRATYFFQISFLEKNPFHIPFITSGTEANALRRVV